MTLRTKAHNHGSKNPRILGVEDDESQHPVIDLVVQTIDPTWEVEWVTTAEAAKLRLDKEPYDLVIADCALGAGESGMDLWQESRNMGRDTPFVFITGLGFDSFLKSFGPDEICPAFLNKPVFPGEAAQIIERLLLPREPKKHSA